MKKWKHMKLEKNRLLRLHLDESQNKLRLLADALEKQNEHSKIWAQRSIALEEQLKIAQDEIDTQSSLIIQRDEALSQLKGMLENYNKQQIKNSNQHNDQSKKIQIEMELQQQKFLETLNQLNQSKAPAKQSFELQNLLLIKKEEEIKELKSKINIYEENLMEMNNLLEESNKKFEKTYQERENLKKLNEDLIDELREIKTGKKEIDEIEKLQIIINNEQQKVVNLQRQKKQLQLIGLQLKQKIEERDLLISQLKDNENIFQEKALEYESRQRNITSKLDEQKKLLSKSLQNEKNLIEKLKNEENKIDYLEKQIKFLQEEKDKISLSNNEKIKNRIQNLKLNENEKLKLKELQIKIRQEIEKRLDSEEEVINLKEQINLLKKDYSLIQEQLKDNKMTDVEPLIELLKELRIEAIAIDNDLLLLINSIPETNPLILPELPIGLCESTNLLITQINSKLSEFQIENRELRIIIQKLIRISSTYHKISNTIAKYPILGIDDIGCQEERGNWVLPVEVEHLQKTIIKLHEIIIRKKTY